MIYPEFSEVDFEFDLIAALLWVQREEYQVMNIYYLVFPYYPVPASIAFNSRTVSQGFDLWMTVWQLGHSTCMSASFVA